MVQDHPLLKVDKELAPRATWETHMRTVHQCDGKSGFNRQRQSHGEWPPASLGVNKVVAPKQKNKQTGNLYLGTSPL